MYFYNEANNNALLVLFLIQQPYIVTQILSQMLDTYANS